jgi:hypothetical protein
MMANQTLSSPGRLSRGKRIVFILVTTGLMVLFAEVSLQIFYRIDNGSWLWNWWAIPIYESDPVRVYRVKPNLDFTHKTSEFSARYLTDAAGMRTDGRQPTPAIPKPPDRFRILALGPSFAFGWGVNYEDAYLHRIVEGLRVPGKQVELVNLGTPSQPPCYQLKWLRETGYLYQPDLIIQTVYGGVEDLDVDDTLPADQPVVRDGFLYPSAQMTFALRIRLLRRYSAILFYGWHLYHAFSHAETVGGDGTEAYRKIGAAGEPPEYWVKHYQQYIEFVHRAVTNKPQVVFLHIPFAWVVRPRDVSRVAHHGDALNPFAARERIAQLIGVLQSNQVDVIDTTSVLLKHDSETRMYNLYDIHFTVAGNKVVADHALPILQHMLTDTPAAQ